MKSPGSLHSMIYTLITIPRYLHYQFLVHINSLGGVLPREYMSSLKIDTTLLRNVFKKYDIISYLSRDSAIRREGCIASSSNSSQSKHSKVPSLPRYDNIPLEHIIHSFDELTPAEDGRKCLYNILQNIEICVAPSWPVLVDFIVRLCYTHKQSFETMVNTIECLRYSLLSIAQSRIEEKYDAHQSDCYGRDIGTIYVSELDIYTCIVVSSKIYEHWSRRLSIDAFVDKTEIPNAELATFAPPSPKSPTTSPAAALDAKERAQVRRVPIRRVGDPVDVRRIKAHSAEVSAAEWQQFRKHVHGMHQHYTGEQLLRHCRYHFAQPHVIATADRMAAALDTPSTRPAPFLTPAQQVAERTAREDTALRSPHRDARTRERSTDGRPQPSDPGEHADQDAQGLLPGLTLRTGAALPATPTATPTRTPASAGTTTPGHGKGRRTRPPRAPAGVSAREWHARDMAASPALFLQPLEDAVPACSLFAQRSLQLRAADDAPVHVSPQLRDQLSPRLRSPLLGLRAAASSHSAKQAALSARLAWVGLTPQQYATLLALAPPVTAHSLAAAEHTVLRTLNLRAVLLPRSWWAPAVPLLQLAAKHVQCRRVVVPELVAAAQALGMRLLQHAPLAAFALHRHTVFAAAFVQVSLGTFMATVTAEDNATDTSQSRGQLRAELVAVERMLRRVVHAEDHEWRACVLAIERGVGSARTQAVRARLDDACRRAEAAERARKTQKLALQGHLRGASEDRPVSLASYSPHTPMAAARQPLRNVVARAHINSAARSGDNHGYDTAHALLPTRGHDENDEYRHSAGGNVLFASRHSVRTVHDSPEHALEARRGEQQHHQNPFEGAARRKRAQEAAELLHAEERRGKPILGDLRPAARHVVQLPPRREPDILGERWLYSADSPDRNSAEEPRAHTHARAYTSYALASPAQSPPHIHPRPAAYVDKPYRPHANAYSRWSDGNAQTSPSLVFDAFVDMSSGPAVPFATNLSSTTIDRISVMHEPWLASHSSRVSDIAGADLDPRVFGEYGRACRQLAETTWREIGETAANGRHSATRVRGSQTQTLAQRPLTPTFADRHGANRHGADRRSPVEPTSPFSESRTAHRAQAAVQDGARLQAPRSNTHFSFSATSKAFRSPY